MNKTKIAVVLTAQMAVTTHVAFAQEQQQNKSLESIIVIGKYDGVAATNLAGSNDVIGRSELEYQHVDDTMELFSKVPGVYFSRYNQGLINTDIAIRGFAGDGGTPHAKLLIDGVPFNLHNGYSEMDQLFPLGIQSIQVFKGTSDARYGMFNIAGNYNLLSRNDVGVTEIEATIGSYSTKEIQAYSGIKNGNFTQNYFVGYRNTNGYRDNTDLTKTAVSGRWFYQLDDDSEIGVIARYSNYDGDAPGYLSREDARNKPKSSAPFANQDGGDKGVRHISLHYNNQLSEASKLTAIVYTQQIERERWVRFSQKGSLTNRYDDQDQSGFTTNLDLVLNDKWSLQTGIDYQTQDNIEQRFGTIGQQRVRDVNKVGRNFRYDLKQFGGFALLNHDATDNFRWNFGVRLDKLSGNFTVINSKNEVGQRQIHYFGVIVQPKLNLFYDLNESLLLFANYGRSFQHPFGSSLYTSGDRKARDVSINDGIEVGTKWLVNQDFEMRFSYWNQDASDEFISIDGVGRNIGETKRNGIDLGFYWAASDRLSFWGNFTTVNSEIVRASDKQAKNVGNELRSIPEFTASFGAQYQLTSNLTGRVHIDAQGDYYVNEANLGDQFGDYAFANAALDYKTNWGNISFQLNNITDEYHEYVYDFGSTGVDTIHSPGDGISGSVSVSYSF